MSITAVPISMLLVRAPAAAEQREGRAELAGEMVDAEIGPVGADFLGRDGELDRLQQGVGGGARLRVRRGAPVPEREETDLLHGQWSLMRRKLCALTCVSTTHFKQAQR